jgi:hypothetical protein
LHLRRWRSRLARSMRFLLCVSRFPQSLSCAVARMRSQEPRLCTILHGHEPHVRTLRRCRRPGDVVGARSGDILCCNNGFNGTCGEQLRIDDGKSFVWKCCYGGSAGITYPDGDQSCRTRGCDIQARLRRDGYSVPLNVLNHAAVFDLDCRECDFIWSGHGRGYDMSLATYSG